MLVPLWVETDAPRVGCVLVDMLREAEPAGSDDDEPLTFVFTGALWSDGMVAGS